MGWISGSVAIITGGASGLGLALTERFVAEGAKVGVIDRDQKRVEQLAARFPDDVEAVVGDVTRFEDHVHVVRRVVTRFGKLNTFISNAGVFDNFLTLEATDAEVLPSAFDELMSVNVKAGILAAKAAYPELVKTHGSLIYTLSNAAFYTGGGGVLYTASKHALAGVVHQLAYEFAPTIRVNGVAPGGMKTNLSGLASTGTKDQTPAKVGNFDDLVSAVTPLAIGPKPEDYCGPYVLLASSANSGPMTGVIIETDGGFGIRGIANTRGDTLR